MLGEETEKANDEIPWAYLNEKKERKRKDLDAWSRIFTEGNIDITGILPLAHFSLDNSPLIHWWNNQYSDPCKIPLDSILIG